MPFLRVDAYEGRSKEQVKELLDAIHRAILSAFGVPLRDRYQVYQEHSELRSRAERCLESRFRAPYRTYDQTIEGSPLSGADASRPIAEQINHLAGVVIAPDLGNCSVDQAEDPAIVHAKVCAVLSPAAGVDVARGSPPGRDVPGRLVVSGPESGQADQHAPTRPRGWVSRPAADDRSGPWWRRRPPP